MAQAAKRAIELGGIYDGHELPKGINKMTAASATALCRAGIAGRGSRHYAARRPDAFLRGGFAEVEVDLETGKYHILDYLAVADVGTVLHPRALGGQVLGRSMLGIGHAIGQKWVYDQHYGLPLAKRFHHNKPPTILDVPENMKWEAVNIPDPETPIGARGIGEPPVGAGCMAILNALSDALGDEVFRRAPVLADTILASLEAGTADGRGPRRLTYIGDGNMAIIRDIMPAFELFQPATMDDALRLLDQHGSDAWVMAGGLDSFRLAEGPHQAAQSGHRSEPGQRAARRARGERRPRNRRHDHAHRSGAPSDREGEVQHPFDRRGAGGIPADSQPGHHRRQRVAGRALLVLSRRLEMLSRRRQHLLRRYADRPSIASTPSCDADRCVAVNPSDSAPALIALEAQMVIRNAKGERVVNAEDYFIGPAIDITRMTVLKPGDLLTAIRIPSTWAGAQFYFEKVRDRQVWDFPLMNVASAMVVNGGNIERIRIVVNAAAAHPAALDGGGGRGAR